MFNDFPRAPFKPTALNETEKRRSRNLHHQSKAIRVSTSFKETSHKSREQFFSILTLKSLWVAIN